MARSRTTSLDLVRLLEQSPDPIYLLDSDRIIVFCNQACCQWTGVGPDDLIGRRVDYVAGDTSKGPPGVAAGLCPPPEAFAGQQLSAHVTCMSRQGRLLYRRARFLPLGEGAADCVGVIAMVEGIDLSAADLQAELNEQTNPQSWHLKLRRFRAAQQRRYDLTSLIGESLAMRQARRQVEAAATSRASTVIVGPQGSGRDRVAHAIHYRQQSSEARPLVPLDCARLDGDLLQAALDTHLRFADKKSEPTLLLSDVDQLTDEARTHLSVYLSSVSKSPWLLSTARVSLLDLAKQGLFPADLAGLLSTLEIALPALAERISDLPLLAQAFLEQCNLDGGHQVGKFSDAALDMLCGYPWPDNLDELAQVVREAHRSATSHQVEASDLPGRLHIDAQAAEFPRAQREPLVLEEFLGQIERRLICWTLERCQGNKSKAAEMLNMTRPRFYRRLEQLQISDDSPEDSERVEG
jgi:DNA-binding NtrC family response regulator